MAPVIDVDGHVYEPRQIWDEYVPTELQAMARSAFFHEIDDQGNRTTIVNGRPAKELNRSRLVRQAIWRPGMTIDDIGGLDPDQFTPLNPGAWDPAQRVADLDALGIDIQVVYPTLFNEYLPLVDNPDAAEVLARAYNDWLWDFAEACGGRVHPVALIPMHSPLVARRELLRVTDKGYTAVVIRPAFFLPPRVEAHDPEGQARAAMMRMMGGGSSSNRVFVEDVPYRGIWALIEELDVVACVHPSLGITGPDAISSGGFADRVSQRLGAQHTIAEPIAYMQDADLFMTAAFFHGLLEDHPNLRLAIAHAGSTWLPLVIEKCETYLWLGGGPFSGNVSLEPSEVLERHPILVSFDGWERPVARMPQRIGTKSGWGSRYPQHDASTPDEARQMLESEGVDSATIEAMMGGRAAELFGLSVPATV
jgi:predicted TIM-barrel fold metal-dependent hydrolase